MIPPPENEYESREDLLSAAQSWALGHGYAVTIKRSVAGKNVQLKCDRGGANVLQEKEKNDRQRVVVLTAHFYSLEIFRKKLENGS
jgi:hypothetical protein